MKRSHAVSMTLLLALSFMGAAWFAERADAPQPEDVVFEESAPAPTETPLISAPESAPEAVPLPAEEEDAPVPVTAPPVPFTSQAPSAKWGDDTFQNSCEEASLVMAAHWLSGEPLTKDIAEKEIVALSAFERKLFGHAVDTSAKDTAQLFHDYYGYAIPEVRYDVSISAIREALSAGSVVIVPTNGRKLGNPNFKAPGPLTHMLVVMGYDAEKKEFVTNDPGTRLGKGYRYAESILFEAIRDYPTGRHLPITAETKAMLIVRYPGKSGV